MPALPASRYLLRAKDLADSRYADTLSVADLAEAARLSPAHFSREFTRVFGESPHRYLLTRRLERAASLLRTTDWSVARVCASVGLSSQGSFTTSFGRMFGTTPTAYRAAAPPAATLVRIPACVRQAYARPGHRQLQDSTFGEDAVLSPPIELGSPEPRPTKGTPA